MHSYTLIFDRYLPRFCRRCCWYSHLFSHEMAKHHTDLVFCRKQPGIALGRLCDKCDGKCIICDSFVRPHVLVHICDECNYGSFEGRCIICGSVGVSDAYYCRECTLQEKDVRFNSTPLSFINLYFPFNFYPACIINFIFSHYFPLM